MTTKLPAIFTTLCLAFAVSIPCRALDPQTPAGTDTQSPSPANPPAAVPGPPAPAAQEQALKKVQVEDLPNFHSVHPFLFRGGEPTSEGLKKVKEMGVSTIIDLRAPSVQVSDEARQADKLGIKSINLPMSSKAPTDKQVKTFLDAVQHAKDNPEKGKVFVHCAHGSDRTGCLVGVWRVLNDGWSYDDAYKEMRKYYFSPKFTNLSHTVERYASKAKPVATN